MKNKSPYSKYIVQKNNTLSGIAATHNMSLDQLLAIAGNKNFKSKPDVIYPGSVVIVSNTYKVQQGDTLTHIAATHDTTLNQLLSTHGNGWFNGNPDLIHPGDIVVLTGNA
jgi:LysM repeat protein